MLNGFWHKFYCFLDFGLYFVEWKTHSKPWSKYLLEKRANPFRRKMGIEIKQRMKIV